MEKEGRGAMRTLARMQTAAAAGAMDTARFLSFFVSVEAGLRLGSYHAIERGGALRPADAAAPQSEPHRKGRDRMIHVLYNPYAGNHQGKIRARRLTDIYAGKKIQYIDMTKIDDYPALLRSLAPTTNWSCAAGTER